MRVSFATLELVELSGTEPPTRFLLFRSGWNKTSKGDFLFDAEAAQSVLASYAEHGVDLAIDLEHQMLGSAAADPTARDARGWFGLAVENGELWAVDVRWSPDGAERLTQKRQRYISPAFIADTKTKRITEILNAAITAMPATHATPALVAASNIGGNMDPKLIVEALDAVVAGDSEKCAELLKDFLAAAGDVVVEEIPASEVPAEVSAAASQLARLTSQPNLLDAIVEVERWRASHLTLEAEQKALNEDRAVLELSRRKANAVKLTQLGAETPTTSGLATGQLCKRLLDEPIEEQSARIAALSVARLTSPKAPAVAAAPGEKAFSTELGSVTLSARELAYCAEFGASPEVYAANKARISNVRG